MKTWVYWYELMEKLAAGLQRAGCALPAAPGLLSSARFGYEAQLHRDSAARIDALVGSIQIEPLAVPAMSSAERYCLVARVRWAQHRLLSFATPRRGCSRTSIIRPPDPKIPAKEVLEWLLIDYWRQEGLQYYLSDFQMRQRAGFFRADFRWWTEPAPTPSDASNAADVFPDDADAPD